MTHPTNDSPASVEEILNNFGTAAIGAYSVNGGEEPVYQAEKAEATARINQLLTEVRLNLLAELENNILRLEATYGLSETTSAIVHDVRGRIAALKDGGKHDPQ